MTCGQEKVKHFGLGSAYEGTVWLGDPMLLITIDEGEESVVLRLEGQLIAPWVAEVEQCWQRAFTSVGDRSVQIDLSAVNFVDTAGEALLARMYEAGF
jgi:anti-anti-sigma regulatory factor